MWLPLILAALMWLTFVESTRAAPGTHVYVLAIGHNGTPHSSANPSLQELRYADDDAIAFARFARDLGGRAIVLSTLDADTARRFPDLAGRVRPPLLDELRSAVRELNASFDQDRRLGLEPLLLVTYSGHGVVEAARAPALVLADSMLTQDVLYAEVLSALKPAYLHLIVDACHAEAVVRPRDVQADTVPLTRSDVNATLSKLTLRGLPHVGSIISGSASAQAHEWERWQQGVFTHEVISGLRGAADVNGDMRVEYSEMAAFLSSANREVTDAAARIKPVLVPPAASPRAAIVDLGARKEAAFLLGRPGRFGGISVEGEDGQRVADLRIEADHYVRLLVPSGRALFVRSGAREAEVTLAPGAQIVFEALRMRSRGMGERGALDLSLQRGLFAATFGPSYYRGFVDHGGELMPVPLSASRASVESALVARPRDAGPLALAWTGVGVASALLVASATFGLVALDARSDFHGAAGLERDSFAASERFEAYGTLALGTLIAGVVTGGVTLLLFTDP